MEERLTGMIKFSSTITVLFKRPPIAQSCQYDELLDDLECAIVKVTLELPPHVVTARARKLVLSGLKLGLNTKIRLSIAQISHCNMSKIE